MRAAPVPVRSCRLRSSLLQKLSPAAPHAWAHRGEAIQVSNSNTVFLLSAVVSVWFLIHADASLWPVQRHSLTQANWRDTCASPMETKISTSRFVWIYTYPPDGTKTTQFTPASFTFEINRFSSLVILITCAFPSCSASTQTALWPSKSAGCLRCTWRNMKWLPSSSKSM